MNTLIGVKNLNSFNSVDEIKRELLIFDKIFIVGLQEWTDVIKKEEIVTFSDVLLKKGLIPLNDYIMYSGYIYNLDEIKRLGGLTSYYDLVKTPQMEYRNQNLDYLIEKGKVIFDYKELTGNYSYSAVYDQISLILQQKLANTNPEKKLSEFYDLCILCHDLKTRILTSLYDNKKYTAVACDSSIYNVEQITTNKSEVYNLILNDFPIIDVSKLSWDQIFEFKNDPEMYNSIWGLRSWISNISNSSKSIGEIEEEYRYLKNQYESGIRLHKLKTSSSIFQTTIQTSAELIENVAIFKLRKVTDLMFKLKENKIALLDAELKSEGNQFSYLFKLKNKFK